MNPCSFEIQVEQEVECRMRCLSGVLTMPARHACSVLPLPYSYTEPVHCALLSLSLIFSSAPHQTPVAQPFTFSPTRSAAHCCVVAERRIGQLICRQAGTRLHGTILHPPSTLGFGVIICPCSLSSRRVPGRRSKPAFLLEVDVLQYELSVKADATTTKGHVAEAKSALASAEWESKRTTSSASPLTTRPMFAAARNQLSPTCVQTDGDPQRTAAAAPSAAAGDAAHPNGSG
ncbi:hypothetical protein MSAN_02404600 [Mycena sanguinolenta]|uniref:Uncharacterized protein n=1 Tax=Mycena sanguinolenta TaxID=230812 RepID=A0A8H6X3S0_9AGAR|nr:hypothetical protein MSAN_02404600 [Mycena sanguinolenta]